MTETAGNSSRVLAVSRSRVGEVCGTSTAVSSGPRQSGFCYGGWWFVLFLVPLTASLL